MAEKNESAEGKMASFTRIIAGAHGDEVAERYREKSDIVLVRIIERDEIGNLDPEIEKDGIHIGHKVLTMTQETYDGLSDKIKANCKVIRF